MTHDPGRDPPTEGGARRVVEVPSEIPKAGRSMGQMLVGVLTLLAILAGALWVLVPLLS